MYKKILIPTDGSPLAAQATNAGVLFAKSIGASVVALHVNQPFSATVGFDAMAATYAITDEAFEKASQESALSFLQAVVDRAKTSDVPATTCTISSYNVAEGISQAAAENNCDLIFIGSHGRSGLSKILVGSVASKVITIAPVAVLVYRVREHH